MRIQHNIMAMSAYRNYTNNVSAMKKNLEKLSSGYKINRAGDDAAGLAISEKMRAQITGLETAQKNAKDGISLVQTAEGALTEVHDMLNRMVELATMSANGTYDNETDRAQLQKEVDQLRDEINRIADSSNFNGIKLLDGSMAADANKISGDSRIIGDVYTSGNAAELSGTKTFLDGEVATTETPTKFTVNFKGLTAVLGAGGAGSYTAAASDTNGTQVTALTDLDLTTTAKLTETAAGNVKTKLGAANITVGGCTVDLSGIDVVKDDTLAGVGEKVKAAIEEQVSAWNTTEAAKNADYTMVKDVNVGLTATGITVDFKTNAQTWADDTQVDFTFKIGGTEFTGAKAADNDTEVAIATAVTTALTANKEAAQVNSKNVVKINGNNYSFEDKGDGTIEFTLEDTPTEDNIAANYDWDVTGKTGDSFDGNHTAGVTVTQAGAIHKDAPVANTVFRIEESDIKDGTKITIDGTTVTLAVGKNSKVDTTEAGVVNLKYMEESAVDLDQAISAISKGFNGAVSGANGTNWTVGVNDTLNDDTHKGLTVHKANKIGTYDTKSKLAAIFEIEKPAGGGLRLQIGDTADTYNQLSVSIKDMHAASLGLSGVDISTQEGAAEAVKAIKAAINTVSDVRGTLGATQNRLDHTINNLSVMTENIQDAESTIRDTDVAAEMMAYTKNNILIQSAQAMLAQANQVPQGVLQLLQ